VDQDLIDEIREARKKVRACRDRLEQHKLAAKEAKESLEIAQLDLDAAILNMLNGQTGLPLLDAVEKVDVAVFTDESWREVDLLLLEGIPPKATQSLMEGGLRTVGELADYTKTGGQLSDLGGIGPATVEKIDAAMDRFWTEWGKAHPVAVVVEGEPDIVPDEEDEVAQKTDDATA
jgi:hypothetical protein